MRLFICVQTFALWGLSTLILDTARGVEPIRFARFQLHGATTYGIVEGTQVRKLRGDLFGEWSKTDALYSLEEVTLLPPTQPTQIFALAGNYRSHHGNQEVPLKFSIPQPFLKSTSCLIAHGESIVLPQDSESVHYEAELVLVIGKRCSRVAREEALQYVLGVTAGNDVSERIWQNDELRKDVQWWRAKGSDTFGPVGPFIVSGLNYDDLMLTLRLNGQVRQQERTSALVHDLPSIVSFISRYVTLQPGDLIFTGTPGETSDLHAGDVVEVELEGVGVLRNPVVAEE